MEEEEEVEVSSSQKLCTAVVVCSANTNKSKNGTVFPDGVTQPENVDNHSMIRVEYKLVRHKNNHKNQHQGSVKWCCCC